MTDHDAPECPLCMELFELDDLHFYPCSCGYQICRFCWHRIRTDGNGLCPACRKTYTEDPAIYRPLSQEEIQKIKKERKQKEAQHKQKISDNRQHLSNIRVIQRHLVFVVGLSNKMADAEILKRHEYFGKYGKIVKIVINPNTNYAGPQGPSASAYITYTKEEDALKAILSINSIQPPLKIRASLGTTKYCTHYLRNIQCGKTDCMYLHDIGDDAASFTKEDMQAGKHQLFEKNLLENYIATHKPKTTQILHDEVEVEDEEEEEEEEEEESNEEEERTVPEDWGDEVDDDEFDEVYPSHSESVLPSQASWGTKEKSIEQNVSITPPKVTSLLPKEQISHKESTLLHHVKVDEYPDIVSANKVTSAAIPIPHVAAETRKKSSNNCSPTPISKIENSIISKNNPLPEPSLKTSFSTGWATSTESVLDDDEEDNDVKNSQSNCNISQNYSWPSVTDLGLSDLKISDDELGFDPFNESKTGLEDLIAHEKQHGIKPTQHQPSYSWDSFWPSNYASRSHQMLNSSYSLFGESQRMDNQPMMQFRPPMMNHFRPNAPPMSASTLGRFDASSTPYRFNQHQPRFPSHFPQQSSFNQNQPQQYQNQPYMNQFRFQPQPNSSQVSTSQPQPFQQYSNQTSTSSMNMTDNKNWQDGLRALLPNINISFANQQFEQRKNEPSTRASNDNLLQKFIGQSGSTDRWNSLDNASKPSITSSIPHQQLSHPGLPSTSLPPPQQVENNVMGTPPPGFPSAFPTAPNIKPSKEDVNTSWFQGTSESFVSRPPPPPGFGLSGDNQFPSQTPGLLNLSSLTNKAQQQQQQHQMVKKPTNQRPPDDPSILWSKILSDQNKELESSPMAFPLPGENMNQSDPMDKMTSNNLPSSQSHSIMPWNTIVSGNQSKSIENSAVTESKKPQPVPSQHTIPSHQHPISIQSKDQSQINETKPQKSSPIFGSQQKHAIKKPTAHVKPLKNIHLDGFTTVHQSRQSHYHQPPQQHQANFHGSSRISELDDFSTEVIARPIVVAEPHQSLINNLQEYPPVSSNQIKSSNVQSGNKKRKKKGKESAEIVSEISQIRVEFQTDKQPIEEERPKKANKSKKKNNPKASPPQERKETPPPQRNEQIKQKDQQQRQNQQQHQIRILKSDGNTGTTMHSPTQMMSEIENPSPKLSSAVHRVHEQVSGQKNYDQQQVEPTNQSHDHEIVSRLTESTEKLLKNVLYETEAIKLNTEQISKDLKCALEKCKESSLSLSDLEKINSLLTPGKLESEIDNPDLVDTSVLERRVESARREAKMLEARLNDVIRKNMESELETLKRNTKGAPS